MVKELKPPFFPPKNKVITDEEVEEKRKVAKPITKMIEVIRFFFSYGCRV